MIWAVVAFAALALVVSAAVVFVLVSTGRLTLDTGVGRRTRTLGPRVVRIEAPRETVFDLVCEPYLSAHPPRQLRDKVEVLERGGDLVLAAHRTRAGGFTAVTVETVAFDRPESISFRLLRGPVPSVTERFSFHELEGGDVTELTYAGEMGTDGWGFGALWGRIVARHWERAVEASLSELKVSAEMKAERRKRRDR